RAVGHQVDPDVALLAAHHPCVGGFAPDIAQGAAEALGDLLAPAFNCFPRNALLRELDPAHLLYHRVEVAAHLVFGHGLALVRAQFVSVETSLDPDRLALHPERKAREVLGHDTAAIGPVAPRRLDVGELTKRHLRHRHAVDVERLHLRAGIAP